MKVFVDCGAYDGCSVRKFREEFDQDCQYHVYSFEPNSLFVDQFLGFENHTFFEAAVWIEDKILPFYLDREDADGSSLLGKKKTGNLDTLQPIGVECLNFSEWVKNNLNIEDEIILKLDIEGAEYEVLWRLIGDNTIGYINKLFIEWHWNKINYPKEKHDELIRVLKQRNVQIVSSWDASTPKYRSDLIKNILKKR